MNFFEQLEQRAREVDSLLCVGLDPRASDAASAREECMRLIDATAEYACAFKPNAAFFEAFGAAGMAASGAGFREILVHYYPNTMVVLAPQSFAVQ